MKGLIPTHITTKGELDALELENIARAVAWMQKIKADGWVEYDVYPPDEFAVRFHHRLVSIHPFSNGNGRHARLMADLILEKIFNKEPFSWGKVNFAKTGDVRTMYIKALKKADDHDYGVLLKFVRS
ncbi:MAG: mobile mystery protein B [Desulfobacterales bacterium]|nr:mobile mystery protein B [Desulfobacterales bacterium]